jgi:hypothetical protein
MEGQLQKKIEDISKLRKIIISNFDDKLSGSCVRGGFSVFHLSTFCLTVPAYKLFGLVKRLNNWHSKLLS